MKSDHYVWLIWASSFLIPWLLLFILRPNYRVQLFKVSIWTAPFGLTEPLFVPVYWNPPSLFNLAQKTGFDIESVIFSFAIGGLGATLYNAITRPTYQQIPDLEVKRPAHRLHRIVLLSPFAVFFIASFFPWNPIYAAIVAMTWGAFATVFCRPDLFAKTILGGFIFVGLYAVFMLGLEYISPGYVERYWNLSALSGFKISKFPIEEFLFGISFGMYWSGIYEHLVWVQPFPLKFNRKLMRSEYGSHVSD